MRRIMKSAASLVLAAALVVTGVYCGGTDAQAAKKPKLTMNKKTVNIEVGGKFTLKVKKATPKKAGKAVTYKTSNKKIATVSKKGVIKGKKVGKATITVTSKSNKKAKAKVTVNVRTASVPTPTPVVTPTTPVTVAPTPTPTQAPSSQPTATKRPTKKPSTPTPVPTEKPKAETPADEVLDVMAISRLDIAEGITKTDNEDGSVTLDFTGTTYKGARWYFIDPATKDAEEPTDKALNLEKYTYVVVEGVNQDGVKLEEVEGQPGVMKGHDLSAQFLDALDHADHGGLLEIETQANMFFPIKFELKDDDRTNVAAFEIYSLGDENSKKTGPITVKSIKAYKDKAAYDKIMEDANATPTPSPDFAATKISKSVSVDGSVSDDEAWADVPELPVANRVKCDNEGDSTTTATAKIAWDENNLYGLVKVTDAEIDAAAANSHQRDGVEFFLDEDYSMDKTFDVNKDAFQYRVTGFKKNDDGTAQDAMTNGIEGGSDDAKKAYAGIEAAYSFTDDGYVVEFKIPFKAAKKAGDFVGFDVIVQDCKAGGRDAEIYLRNTTDSFDYWNLSDTFGTLKLEDAASGGEEK